MMCDGIRHDFKWHTFHPPVMPEGWYCTECHLEWKDDPKRKPIANPEPGYAMNIPRLRYNPPTNRDQELATDPVRQPAGKEGGV